jgi:hypothetical protein
VSPITQKRSSPQEALILAAIKLAMINAVTITAKVREIREARAGTKREAAESGAAQ